MKKYILKSLNVTLDFFVIVLGFNCGTYLNQNTGKSERYSCRDYEFSAALMEMVDAETNGKISGDTHFHSKGGNEIFYSYQRYNSSREAFDKLKKEQKETDKTLEEIELMNGGKVVGKKIVVFAEKKGSFGIDKNYYLLWIKESVWTETSMFYRIRSKSLAGIKEMEKECKF